MAGPEEALALDLYLREGTANKTHLPSRSFLLNSIGGRFIRTGTRPDFRPCWCCLKLASFAALDPTYEGVRMFA